MMKIRDTDDDLRASGHLAQGNTERVQTDTEDMATRVFTQAVPPQVRTA